MTPTTSLRRRLRAPAIIATAVAGLVLVLGACSGGLGDGGGGGSGDVDMAAQDERGDRSATSDSLKAVAPEESAARAFDAGADGAVAGQVADTPRTPAAQRAVISTATISLHSEDVAGARFDVQKLVDTFRGEIAEEETEGGEEAKRSRLVIRVPSAEFDEAVAALEKVGDLESSTRASQDVTTTVIDNAARIRAQEESLGRVEVLLGRATSIRDIVAIESQLTRRQADLDSLKSQQAYLADQTSMSTITVHIERPSAKEKKPDTDETGFLPGLDGGWDALVTFGTGLATVAGALLPFAIVLALLGVPAWLAARRLGLLGRRRSPTPAAPANT